MNIILWYNKRIMESPIGSAQRAEWIKIKREIEVNN